MTAQQDSSLGVACAGLGLLLPLLAGGNVLFLLEPAPALGYFAAVVLAFALLRFRLGEPTRLRPHSIALAALFLFVAWWCGQTLLRPSGPRALIDSGALACAALLFAVLSFRPFSRAELARFVAGLAAGASVTTLYGQYQYWIMYPRVRPLFREIYGRAPIVSINANFYNANCYAPFLAATLLLVMVVAVERGDARHRWALLTVPPLVVTLFLTESRATVVLLAAAGLALIVFGTRRFPGRRLVFAGLAAAGVAAAWIGSLWIAPGELWQYAFLGRLAIWQAAGGMIADHWVLGVGVGRFAELFPAYQVTDYYTRYPHNLLLEVFAETGVVGLLALLAFLAAGFRAALPALRMRRVTVGAGAFVAAALLVFHAMLDIDWRAPANPILLTILLASAREPGAVS